jgi:hypothetical protein
MDKRIAKWETKTALIRVGRENLEEQFRRIVNGSMTFYMQNRVSTSDRKLLATRLLKILKDDTRTLFCEHIFCNRSKSHKLYWVIVVSDLEHHQKGSQEFSSNECRILSYTFLLGKKSILRLERPFNYSIDEHAILRYMNRTNQSFVEFVRDLSHIFFQTTVISMHYTANNWTNLPIAISSIPSF